jgi:hypothetical protein
MLATVKRARMRALCIYTCAHARVRRRERLPSQIPTVRLFGPSSEGNKIFVYKGELGRREIVAFVDGHLERFRLRQQRKLLESKTRKQAEL